MFRWKHILASLFALYLVAAAGFEAMAADIHASRDSVGNKVILLHGQIVEGDAEKLKQFVEEQGRGALSLNSPGGSFKEALRIVDALYDMGTLVDRGAACYSACALIFMAGRQDAVSWNAPNRKLHYRGKLGFHAPYLKGVKGQFSGEAIEKTYRAAVLSLREVMKREIGAEPVIPPSLLVEMLAKGPEEALLVDTVDKAGRWRIEVIGFMPKNGFPQITRRMFCVGCSNHMSWRSYSSAADLPQGCTDQGALRYTGRDGFSMTEPSVDAGRGHKSYNVRILFPGRLGQDSECQLVVSTENGRVQLIFGRFRKPGANIDFNDRPEFFVEPSHLFDPTTPLRSLRP